MLLKNIGIHFVVIDIVDNTTRMCLKNIGIHFEVIDIVNNTTRMRLKNIGIHFEVIDIVDNITPYQAIINLKTQKTIFELGYYRVVAPLDPSQGGRYVELAAEKFITKEINQFYGTTTLNPTKDGMLRWRRINSYASDFDTMLP